MAAKTRLGLGGPSKNYTRPVAAKIEAVDVGPPKHEGMLRNVGKMMN